MLRVASGTMELGLGIHGEPGAKTAPLQPVDGIVAEVHRVLSQRNVWWEMSCARSC